MIHKTDTGEIVITSDITRELRRYKINNVASLAELARLMGFKYGSVWTDKTIKAAFGHITKFIEFLDLR
jgi:ribosomal protein L18